MTASIDDTTVEKASTAGDVIGTVVGMDGIVVSKSMSVLRFFPSNVVGKRKCFLT